MASEHTSGGGFLLHTIITAFVAVLPEDAWSYAKKLVSVLVLAIVAEIGRQFVIRLGKSK